MTKDRFSTGPSGRMPISAIGIPWYREDDYSEVLRIMADGKVLPDTFKDWHQKAQAVERQVKASGKLAHRAIVDPKAFVGWCAIPGQSAPSGQFSDIHCIARSTRRIPMSAPRLTSERRLPSLNSREETVASASPEDWQYTDTTDVSAATVSMEMLMRYMYRVVNGPCPARQF